MSHLRLLHLLILAIIGVLSGCLWAVIDGTLNGPGLVLALVLAIAAYVVARHVHEDES